MDKRIFTLALLIPLALLVFNCGIGQKVNPLLEPSADPVETSLNWQPGDVLYGGSLDPWYSPIRWAQEIIRFVTDGESHVMLVCYPDPRLTYAGNWIVADCSFSHGVSWQSVSEIPRGYSLHRNPHGFVFSELSMFDAVKDDIGNYYDVLELIEYLKRDEDFPKGISEDMFTCASWIQHVMKDQGFVPFPDKAATPEYFGQWPEVMIWQ